MCKGTGYYINAFARTQRSEEQIGLARCRLLCGRTIDQVDAIHLRVLEAIAPGPSSHRGLMLLDEAKVPELLARLAELAPDEEDLALDSIIILMRSSWGHTCRVIPPRRSGNRLFV